MMCIPAIQVVHAKLVRQTGTRPGIAKGKNLVDEIDVSGYPQLTMDYTYDANKNVTN